MRILFVMDPLKKLDPVWDNSLYLSDELARRGHENWISDASDLISKKNLVHASCGRLIGKGRPWPKRRYEITARRTWNLYDFDLILIRKEPPVDQAYRRMTLLLERIARKVPIANHPRGVRLTNEKLSILDFPGWIPKTIVTASFSAAHRLQTKIKQRVVIKPLDQKGGKGVFILSENPKTARKQWMRATRNGKIKVMAQEFVSSNREGEKRIVILGGQFFASYEKRAKAGEFRANLGLGASFHRTTLSRQERRLLQDLKPYLLKRGLHFVGIDVLAERLIEINVTSPAGVTEAKFLNPKLRAVESWAGWLERFARARKHQS